MLLDQFWTFSSSHKQTPNLLSVTTQSDTVPEKLFSVGGNFLMRSAAEVTHFKWFNQGASFLYYISPYCFFWLDVTLCERVTFFHLFLCVVQAHIICVQMDFSFGLFVENSSWYQYCYHPLLISTVFFETLFLPEPGPSIFDYIICTLSWGKSAYLCLALGMLVYRHVLPHFKLNVS